MFADWILYVSSFGLAWVLSVYFTGVMRRAALKWGVLDRPNTDLKRHRDPVPYLGGVGIYLGFILTMGFVFTFSPQVLGMLLAGTIVLLIGLVDDLGVLSPGQKFLGQSLAAFALMKAGILIDVDFFGGWWPPAWEPWLHLMRWPITFLWVVGVTNAVNIIDIMDGLAGSVAVAAAMALFAVAVLNHNPAVAAMAVVLAGSVLGFLAYNRHPAKIYMGDAGALFVGTMLGALAVTVDYSRRNPVAYVGPLLILGVPLFDLGFVVLLRLRKGLNPFYGSPDHFALRLKRIGVPVPRIAAGAGIVTAVLGGIAVLNIHLSPDAASACVAAVAAAILAAGVALARIDMSPRPAADAAPVSPPLEAPTERPPP